MLKISTPIEFFWCLGRDLIRNWIYHSCKEIACSYYFDNLKNHRSQIIYLKINSFLFLRVQQSQNYQYIIYNISQMKTENKKKVIVIGGGLSGLSAARQLLKTNPDIELTVLEAMDRVGGRTHTVNISGFLFDEGAEFIGESQMYAMELAIQSGNQILDQYRKGTKIIEMGHKVFRYESDIPSNLNLWLLIEMQILLWKINRMARKVSTLNPKDCDMGYHWDSMSVHTWINQNVRSPKIKVMIELACRSILGAQPSEISFLYFLWYVHQSRDLDNMINVKNGLQERKTKLGTQHMSKYLAQVIQSQNGKVLLNVFVDKIEQRQNVCIITDRNNRTYECDYLIVACAPWQVNKIRFFPLLSYDRKLLCQRSFMGSYIKVILLYKKAYWREKGLSGQILTDCLDSPLMTAYDDTKYNQNGEAQPALLVFIAGFVYRQWKDRKDFQKTLINKFAEIIDEPEMLEPVKVFWKAWEDEPSIGGGPTGVYGPGVLSQVEDLRKPEGLIHWAGTELATVSAGYMDGAIESGIRAAKQVQNRLKGRQWQQHSQKLLEKGFWYTKYLRSARKWIQWL